MRCLACACWKKINVYFLIVMFLFFVPASGAKGESTIQSGGEVNIRLFQDTKEDTAYEDHEQVRTQFDVWTKFKKNGFSAYVSGRTEGEWLIGDDTQKDVDVTLRQAYISADSDRWALSLGKQVVTWGKLDNVIVVDRINPQDFRWFVMDDKQERKDPVWMMQAHYFGDNYDAELLYIPFFRASKIDFFGSDWAVFDHLKEAVEKGNYSASAKSIISGVRIKDKDKLTQDTFANGEWGIRFRNRIGNVDCAFYYMYIHSRVPVLREKTSKGNTLKRFLYTPSVNSLNELAALNPANEDLVLEKEYPGMNVIGGDFETIIIGEYGLRGEYGLFLGAPYLRSDFSYVEKDRLSFGLGIDHTTAQDWYYNLQFIEDIILDYEELFAQEEYSHEITFNLKKDFLRGNLLFALDCAYSLSYGDSMFNPEVRYKFNGGVEAALGGFIFEGDSTTLFGRYNAKDLVYMEMKYRF
ncbi:MAG: hypothetical protein B1H08_01805 [Candidatus Omnitrophica bacterium 4484_171]|nr:MAG: hypothetical protein B1H08_01805 [Candidatus Omnitrophica bacterium 4484_171]